MKYREIINILTPELLQLEEKWIYSDKTLIQSEINDYFNEVVNFVNEFNEKLNNLPKSRVKFSFKNYWKKYNKLNKII